MYFKCIHVCVHVRICVCVCVCVCACVLVFFHGCVCARAFVCACVRVRVRVCVSVRTSVFGKKPDRASSQRRKFEYSAHLKGRVSGEFLPLVRLAESGAIHFNGPQCWLRANQVIRSGVNK